MMKMHIENKKIILIGLAVILAIESFWAFSYIGKSKSKTPVKTVQTTIVTVIPPKEKIASMVLTPSNQTVKTGEQFSVKINIDTAGKPVNGIDAVVLFDPKVLTPAPQAEAGDLFPTLLINNIDPVEGKVTLTGTRISANSTPVTGTGTFAVLTFTAKQTGTTKLTIKFDPRKTNASNITESITSRSILTTVTNAQIQITE